MTLNTEDYEETFRIQCRYCGKYGLKWEDEEGREYVLIDSKGDIHHCVQMIHLRESRRK